MLLSTCFMLTLNLNFIQLVFLSSTDSITEQLDHRDAKLEVLVLSRNNTNDRVSLLQSNRVTPLHSKVIKLI